MSYSRVIDVANICTQLHLKYLVKQYFPVNLHSLENKTGYNRTTFTMDTINYGLYFHDIEGALFPNLYRLVLYAVSRKYKHMDKTSYLNQRNGIAWKFSPLKEHIQRRRMPFSKVWNLTWMQISFWIRINRPNLVHHPNYDGLLFVLNCSIHTIQVKGHVEKPLNPSVQLIWIIVWKMAKDLLFQILLDDLQFTWFLHVHILVKKQLKDIKWSS
jgi:hypothetical protein